MGSNQPVLSRELMTLKEKINLKKLDREVYIHQTEAVLQSKRHERHALRVGNACLTHMTSRQLMMPMTLNAACFAQHKYDKLRMQSLPLNVSIGVNDSILFKWGKKLLKQDYVSRCSEESLENSKRNLTRAKIEAKSTKEDFEHRYERFLHKQVMVEDSRDRENSAKLTHLRLQKILDVLNKDNLAIPLRIKEKEKRVADMQLELHDFTLLKDRALKYLEVEKDALKPVNFEMSSVTHHFDNIILNTRNDLDNRRKSVALAKFLADREANPLSFVETANVMEIQFKRRNKAIGAYDMIIALKDAVMVSHFDDVVDCFKDQDDLVALLGEERFLQGERNRRLREKLSQVLETNQYLKYMCRKTEGTTKVLDKIFDEEVRNVREVEQGDIRVRKQDKLKSTLQIIAKSLAGKLRAIKLDDTPSNTLNNSLLEDIQLVVKKVEKMVQIIESNTVPVGPVKPIMLDLYKEERLPPDCVRIDLTPHGLAPAMTAFEKFEADSPGFVTREMLKARAAENQAEHDRKRKGKRRGRKK